jgi:hypothetical protein
MGVFFMYLEGTMIIPAWIKDVGPIGAVAIVAILAMLKIYTANLKSNNAMLDSLAEMGKSRDQERRDNMEMMERKDLRSAKLAEIYSHSIDNIVGLAHTMVNQCQTGIPERHKVKPAEITDAVGSGN